jgi:hypothetical protein
LEQAAFGDAVGRWPLAVPNTPAELWLRAVAAAGQGRYASAQTDLAQVRRVASPESPVVSLAHSTTGSLLRQLGWHHRARHWDGVALRLAGDDAHARADALVGLAADALGVGRFGVSATLLHAAGALSGTEARQSVRLAWVSAELAMAQGRGAEALQYAHAGVARAAAAASTRHRVKSDVVLAAALCTNGNLADARVVADAALTETGECGLIPLRWAVASLLAGIGSDIHTSTELTGIRDSAAAVIERRGGRFADR